MIIARSPLRVTLGGGGTDLPSYYRAHGGFLMAAAIDKYVYVAVGRPLTRGIYLNYSTTEHAETINEVQHRIIREVLRLMEPGPPQIEITTFADIPWGTGLGSSGSFTTALLQALHAQHGTEIDPYELAEQACHIEIDMLGEPIGKQDQYIAAVGGLTCFTFGEDGAVASRPLILGEKTQAALEESILLFFTGSARSASNILRDQVTRLDNGDKALFADFDYEKENAFRLKEALEAGDLASFGQPIHEHWERKRKRSSGISNPKIDRWYDIGLGNGATGGKLLGAGGGGFLMFFAADGTKLRRAMRDEGLVELRFRFDNDGTRILAQ